LLAHADGRGIRIVPVADVDESGALVPIELMDPAGRPVPPTIEIGRERSGGD
jgi:hypothetical protein